MAHFFIEEDMESILKEREGGSKKMHLASMREECLVFIVEGHPGIGKTTLAHKITKGWTNGTVLQNVCMVFLISLHRDKK